MKMIALIVLCSSLIHASSVKIIPTGVTLLPDGVSFGQHALSSFSFSERMAINSWYSKAIATTLNKNPGIVLRRGDDLAILPIPLIDGSRVTLGSINKDILPRTIVMTNQIASSVQGHIQEGNFGLANKILTLYFDNQGILEENLPPAEATAIRIPITFSPPKTFGVYVPPWADVMYIEPGEFDMGSPETEDKRDGDETLHHVKLTNPIEMRKHFVSEREFEDLMHRKPRHDWLDAIEYANALSKKMKLEPVYEIVGKLVIVTAPTYYGTQGYRLMTEAEWERARREGRIDGHDLEWVWDRYGGYPALGSTITNPEGPDTGEERVIRGRWFIAPKYERPSIRYVNEPDKPFPDVHFRLVRTIE